MVHVTYQLGIRIHPLAFFSGSFNAKYILQWEFTETGVTTPCVTLTE